MKLNPKTIKTIYHILTILSLVVCLAFFIYGIQTKLFYSEEALEAFLDPFGIWAPSSLSFFNLYRWSSL
ncbi:hypothetical protein [Gracilibacillus sp. JCM 18860]|uniref:hypothetical protein n=1 Tax=Gracilibacillus sp. JCM 18860 TaxID=1306159 RepID=UPI000A5E04F1